MASKGYFNILKEIFSNKPILISNNMDMENGGHNRGEYTEYKIMQVYHFSKKI